MGRFLRGAIVGAAATFIIMQTYYKTDIPKESGTIQVSEQEQASEKSDSKSNKRPAKNKGKNKCAVEKDSDKGTDVSSIIDMLNESSIDIDSKKLKNLDPAKFTEMINAAKSGDLNNESIQNLLDDQAAENK